MLHRLFYLFPDENHAQRVVNELGMKAVEIRRMHAIARGVELKSLPKATERQQRDTGFLLERFLWIGNLLIFLLTMVVFLVLLVVGEYLWSTLALAVMLGCFVLGEQFVVHVPSVHLTEFTDALAHGEVLLMIDVPSYRVAEIDGIVHQHHPEAITGGVGWTPGCLGI